MHKERLSLFPRILLIGIGLALFYFWMSLLFNFYTSVFARILATFLWGVVFGAAGRYLLKKELPRDGEIWEGMGILLLDSFLAFAVIFVALRYPTLFKVDLFVMERVALPGFILAMLLAFGSVTMVSFSLPIWLERPLRFLDEHLFGLVLSGIFFISYFLLATIFNQAGIWIVDSFFEADNSFWLSFLGMDTLELPLVRAVHPLAYLILRPLTWLVSLALNGNTYYAILIVIAAGGALSVFLVWLFLRENGQGRAFSLGMASLLGVTTTHLLFGSFAESYIFSAAALLLFFVILQRQKSTLKTIVPAGLLVFGITISNLAQTVIGFFFLRRNFKQLIRYVLILLFFAVLLSVVNNFFNPYDSGYFFIPSDLLKEQNYAESLLDYPAWKISGRIYATVRNVFFYTTVAPSSFFVTPDPGKPLPRMSFFHFDIGEISYGAYDGAANLLLFSWLGLLLLAGLTFLWTLRKRQAWCETHSLLSFALLANIAFNLFFHIVYGEDPFLYSADWAYAFILFTAISLGKFARHWWGRLILVVFLAAVMVNNLIFVDRLIAVLAGALHT